MATHGIDGHGVARRGPTGALALLALALAACGGDGSSDAPFNPLLSDGGGDAAPKTLSSITLSPSPVSLPVNGMQPLTATGHYSDGSTATLSGLTWTSSSTSIATVTSSGVVTGVGTGSTSVSARDPATGISAPVSVTVAVKTLSSITLLPSSVSVAVGGSQQVSATGHYTDGSAAALGGLTWWSNYGTIASVSSSGLVTGVSPGGSYVYAQDPASGTYAFVYVTVH